MESQRRNLRLTIQMRKNSRSISLLFVTRSRTSSHFGASLHSVNSLWVLGKGGHEIGERLVISKSWGLDEKDSYGFRTGIALAAMTLALSPVLS